MPTHSPRCVLKRRAMQGLVARPGGPNKEGLNDFHGSYCFPNCDLFCGVVDIRGKPNGKGIMYYFASGEADVGIFDGERKQKGVGVRFDKDRGDVCTKLEDGIPTGELHIDKALELMALEQAPVARRKDLMPQSSGFDANRHRQTSAWYVYRKLAELPQNVGLEPNPYPPKWKKDEEEETDSEDEEAGTTHEE